MLKTEVTYYLPKVTDKEGMFFKSKVTDNLGQALPKFIKVTIINMGEISLTIAPDNKKQIGQYLVQVTLDDMYASPYLGTFKIIVDDPLSSKYTKSGKGLKDEIISNDTNSKQRVNIIKASIRIKEATRDGRLLLKVIAERYADEIVKSIGND